MTKKNSPLLAGAAIWRLPAFWLGVTILLAWLTHSAGRGLDHQRVPDTRSYLTTTARLGSPVEALGQIRTIGYPSVLRMFRTESGSIRLARVPAFHLAVFSLAVSVFWWALWRFTGSPWLALASASALLISPAMTLLRRIQPDFLAASFVVLSLSFLLLLVERAGIGRWVGLALCVFATYQLRPAGSFLIALLPILGGLFLVLRNGRRPAQAVRFAVLMAAVTVGPFLGFAVLRWATVGHFGLVSFGGCNAAGMAACFLDTHLVEELPAEQQRLARRVLRERRKRGFQPMRRGDQAELWFEQFGPNIFSISVAVAKAEVKRETRASPPEGARIVSGVPVTWAVEVNDRLSAFAKEIVKRRIDLYRNWVRAAVRYGMRQLTAWPSIVWPFVALVVSLPLGLLRSVSVRRSAGPDKSSPDKSSPDKSSPDKPSPENPGPENGGQALRARALLCLTLAGGSFFVAYIVLISLVSFPFERYFVSTVLFIPSVLVALLFETWRLILEPETA